MAPIRPGTGGTFEAATAEGRALEVLLFIQLAEQKTTQNPDNRNTVTGSFDSEEMTFSGTFVIPAAQRISEDGSLLIGAVPYLVGVTVNPGSGSPTFKSTLPERYLLEVLMYLQAAERSSDRNPQNRNAITGTYNSDTEVYTGSFTLPISMQVVGGKVEIGTVEYLVNLVPEGAAA